jgi:hypothetical protein
MAVTVSVADNPSSKGYVATPLTVILADLAALGGRQWGSLAIVRLGTGRGAAVVQALLLAPVLVPMTALGANILVSLPTPNPSRGLNESR